MQNLVGVGLLGACYSLKAHFKTVTNPSSNADGLREPPRSYKPKGEPLKGEPRPAPAAAPRYSRSAGSGR